MDQRKIEHKRSGLQIYAIGDGTHVLFQHYAVVALLEVQIPLNANPGDTYSVNVLYPSATSDGYNQNVPLTPMAQVTITVTNIPYTVGDTAGGLGSWYNAGTFGDENLDNSDVNQAFDAASGLRSALRFFRRVQCDGRLSAWTRRESCSRRRPNPLPRLADHFVTGAAAGHQRLGARMVGGRQPYGCDNRSHHSGRFVDNPQIRRAKSLPYTWYKQALVGGVSVGNVAPGGPSTCRSM